jgi:hypothetical protein
MMIATCFLGDIKPDERSALRLMLQNPDLEVVDRTPDWPTTLAQARSRQLLGSFGL